MRKVLLLAVLCALAVLALAPAAMAQDDTNCDDYETQADAQAALNADRSDPNNLDADDDGEACETYPYGDSGDDNGTAAEDQYNGTAAEDQYNGGVDDNGGVNDSDEIISDTISKKPLPNTGGVPLFGLAVGVLALVGVGFSVLRT